MHIFVFARLHATSWQDMAAFDRHVELPHTVRFVEAVEPLLDHPLKVTLSEQLW
jgi:quinol monooxygenase YgiN